EPHLRRDEHLALSRRLPPLAHEHLRGAQAQVRVSARGERFWRAYALVERALVLLNRVPVGERAVTVGRERLYADSVDRLLALLSWKLGLGESEERALVARVARPGMIAVDVGANVGLHALALARLVGQG